VIDRGRAFRGSAADLKLGADLAIRGEHLRLSYQ
jgi:hypothetical protein